MIGFIQKQAIMLPSIMYYINILVKKLYYHFNKGKNFAYYLLKLQKTF
jgi:hypothetical protein